MATFIAPLSSGFGLSVALAAAEPSTFFQMGFFIGWVAFLLITYPISFIALCILGWPCYFLLKLTNYLSFATLSLIGIPLGAVTAFVLGGHIYLYPWLLQGAFIGFCVSTTAAIVIIQNPSESQ